MIEKWQDFYFEAEKKPLIFLNGMPIGEVTGMSFTITREQLIESEIRGIKPRAPQEPELRTLIREHFGV